jgi:hypothetical protein
MAERFSVGATRQILLPLALTGPWLLLLLGFWFTTVFRHLGGTPPTNRLKTLILLVYLT